MSEDGVEHLLDLQPGWDGRRAPAPSGESLRLGRMVLDLGYLHGMYEPRVAADVEGRVAVYFFGGERHADGGFVRKGAIMVSNDGEMTYWLRDRSQPSSDSDSVVKEVSEDGLGRAVQWIQWFLSGL